MARQRDVVVSTACEAWNVAWARRRPRTARSWRLPPAICDSKAAMRAVARSSLPSACLALEAGGEAGAEASPPPRFFRALARLEEPVEVAPALAAQHASRTIL